MSEPFWTWQRTLGHNLWWAGVLTHDPTLREAVRPLRHHRAWWLALAVDKLT